MEDSQRDTDALVEENGLSSTRRGPEFSRRLLN